MVLFICICVHAFDWLIDWCMCIYVLFMYVSTYVCKVYTFLYVCVLLNAAEYL